MEPKVSNRGTWSQLCSRWRFGPESAQCLSDERSVQEQTLNSELNVASYNLAEAIQRNVHDKEIRDTENDQLHQRHEDDVEQLREEMEQQRFQK